MPQDKKFTLFVCVYGIVMCTVQWCVSTELWFLDSSDVSTEQWCLHSSGLCLWYSGVYSTVLRVHGIVVSTVKWCVSME